MEIVLAKSAGFCYGVKRATNLAFDEANRADKGTFTLGPIIHNPQVVDKLSRAGVHVVDDVDEMRHGTLIIRSHGVPREEMERAEKKGLRIVDATCPFVKKAQDFTALLRDEGYFIVLIGDIEHPEIKSILSSGGNDIIVVESPVQLKQLPRKKKIGVVAQTTQSMDKIHSVVSECLGKTSELRVFNTICGATSVRQEQSQDIARISDCMIVVGGYNSANTKRLADICRAIQPNTHHIEVADEIDISWLKESERVGITAGASTPDWLIEEVMDRIRKSTGS